MKVYESYLKGNLNAAARCLVWGVEFQRRERNGDSQSGAALCEVK